MGNRLFLGTFEQEEDLLNATNEFRKKGYRIWDVFTPYAVHGLDEAMGLKPSILPYACFVFGLFGVIFSLAFQFWVSAIDWPINVGGKPWNSLPAFLPVTFEIMVLFAGVGSVFTFFVLGGLFPGKPSKEVAPGVTDHHFVLVLLEDNASFDAEIAKEICRKHHVVSVKEEVEA